MSIAYYPIKPTTFGAQIQFPNGAFHQDGYTTLTANMSNNSTTPIQVTSTTGFLSAGALIIGSELIRYTGKTATTFTGITRGAYGSTNVAHTAGVYVSEAQPVPAPAKIGVIEDIKPPPAGPPTAAPTIVGKNEVKKSPKLNASGIPV